MFMHVNDCMFEYACILLNEHISYVGFTLILKYVGFHQKPTTFICKCFPCLKPSLFPWVVRGVPKGQVWNTDNRQTPQPPSGAVLRCTDIKGEVETCYKILESNRSQRQFDGNGGWIEVMYIYIYVWI